MAILSNVFERTVRQVEQRQQTHQWSRATRAVWLEELRPIAEFYSALSEDRAGRTHRGLTPGKESFVRQAVA